VLMDALVDALVPCRGFSRRGTLIATRSDGRGFPPS
jgi:hypothetical protein